MKHRIVHGLSHALAREATRHALETYRQRFPQVSPTGRWLDDDNAEVQFTVAGTTLKGGVEVTDEAVELELDVPMVFRPFRKKAMSIIEEEVREWIEKARRGQLTI